MEKGIVSRLNKKHGYGFIRDGNGDEVFFHANDLINVYFPQLQLGNVLFFDAALTENGFSALKVERQNENKTTPGINRSANLSHFNPTERSIVAALSRIFYISYGGRSFKMGIDSKLFILLT